LKVLSILAAVSVISLSRAAVTNERTGATYSTVASAVAAVSAGDVLALDPGVYSESFVIDRPVTLKGPQAGIPGYVEAGGNHVARSGPEATIVGNIGIASSDITLNGLTLQGPDPDQNILPTVYGVDGRQLNNVKVINCVIPIQSQNAISNDFASTVRDWTVKDNFFFGAFNRWSQRGAYAVNFRNAYRVVCEANVVRVEDSTIIYGFAWQNSVDFSMKDNVFEGPVVIALYCLGNSTEITGNVLKGVRMGVFFSHEPALAYPNAPMEPDAQINITNNRVECATTSWGFAPPMGIQVSLRGSTATYVNLSVNHNSVVLNGDATPYFAAPSAIDIRADKLPFSPYINIEQNDVTIGGVLDNDWVGILVGGQLGVTNITNNTVNGGNHARAGIEITTLDPDYGAAAYDDQLSIVRNAVVGCGNAVQFLDRVNNAYSSLNLRYFPLAANNLLGLSGGGYHFAYGSGGKALYIDSNYYHFQGGHLSAPNKIGNLTGGSALGSAAEDDAYFSALGSPLNVEAPGVRQNDLLIFNPNVSVVLASAPTHGTVTLDATGAMQYVANSGFIGNDTFTYRLALPDGTTTNAATVTVTTAPELAAIDDSAATLPSVPVLVPVLDNDFSGVGHGFSIGQIEQPSSGGSIVRESNAIRFRPTSNTGTVTFRYRLKDDVTGSLSDWAMVSVRVFRPKILNVTAPASVTGGDTFQVQVELAEPAPCPFPLTVTSSDPSVGSAPAGVTVGTGETLATFNVTTPHVTSPKSVAIRAESPGNGRSATVNVLTGAVTGITMSTTARRGGGELIAASVNFDGKPNIAQTVTVTSDSPAVPSQTIAIPVGSDSKFSFGIDTNVVTASTNVQVTISVGGKTLVKTVTITPIELKSIGLDETSVVGGNSRTLTLVLNAGLLPGKQVAVSLSSSSGYVLVPASITILGSDTAIYTLETRTPNVEKSVKITAQLGTTRTVSLLLKK